MFVPYTIDNDAIPTITKNGYKKKRTLVELPGFLLSTSFIMRFLLLFSAIFLSSNAAVLSKRKGVFKSELTRVSARNHRVLAQGNQTLVDYTDDYYMGYVYFGTPRRGFLNLGNLF